MFRMVQEKKEKKKKKKRTKERGRAKGHSPPDIGSGGKGVPREALSLIPTVVQEIDQRQQHVHSCPTFLGCCPKSPRMHHLHHTHIH